MTPLHIHERKRILFTNLVPSRFKFNSRFPAPYLEKSCFSYSRERPESLAIPRLTYTSTTMRGFFFMGTYKAMVGGK
jgi:hypothetical protein